MKDVRERLEDLVADIPDRMVPDIAAARSLGDRRRRVRRVAVVGAAGAVAALALVATSFVSLPRETEPTDNNSGEGVGGYPLRVEEPLWPRSLPEASGPLAGLIEVGEREWMGFTDGGDVHRLDFVNSRSGNYPSLSPDGTHVAYVDDDYLVAVRDLVSGDVVRFPNVSGGQEVGGATLFWTAQSPAAWSPDGTRLLVSGGDLGDGPARTVMLGTDGSAIPVRYGDNPAGWLDDDRAILVSDNGAELRTIDREGDLVDGVVLRGLDRGGALNQFSPLVSVDGDTLLLSRIDDHYVAETERWDLATGRRLEGSATTRNVNTWCPSSITPSTITFSTRPSGDALHVEVMGGGTLVVVDPSLEPSCVMLASDALTAGPRPSLVDRLLDGVGLGSSSTPDLRDNWIAWHWREVALSVLAVSLWWLRRRLRRSTADD
jgi:hypothetical protein